MLKIFYNKFWLKEIEMVKKKKDHFVNSQSDPRSGRCGLCETINIPMENDLFCIYCYLYYFV